MQIANTKKELQKQIAEVALSPVGLVPTMGALHEGHLSLIRKSIETTPLTVVSVYVNPTQFNDKEDFNKYPRTIENDLSLLKNILRDNDIVFTPTDKEMYPEKDTREFHFGNLDNVMEAVHRPGHFNGVGQIVSKLFENVKPDMAFFGLKDFQQVAVVKNLVKQMGADITIVPCPIIRESDGLALSSRNRLLDPEIRKAAPAIYKTLCTAASMFPDTKVSDIKKFVDENISMTKLLKTIYFEIVDDEDLIPLSDSSPILNKSYYGCIAVLAGKIRLIDNVIMNQ